MPNEPVEVSDDEIERALAAYVHQARIHLRAFVREFTLFEGDCVELLHRATFTKSGIKVE